MAERQRQRVAAYRRYAACDSSTREYRCLCPWCGGEIDRDSFDLHEVIVRRSNVPRDEQGLIFVPENMIPVHPLCHTEYGNTQRMKLRCLLPMIRVLGASKIGCWYVSLWQEHGLSVPKGMLLDRKAIPARWCIDMMWVGARVHGELNGVASAVVSMADEDWLIRAGEATWDFRMLVAWKWQGYNKKSKKRNMRRPPEEYAGVRQATLAYFLDEGYWIQYLVGACGFTIEELLNGE